MSTLPTIKSSHFSPSIFDHLWDCLLKLSYSLFSGQRNKQRFSKQQDQCRTVFIVEFLRALKWDAENQVDKDDSG